jgi:hypothetical protein
MEAVICSSETLIIKTQHCNHEDHNQYVTAKKTNLRSETFQLFVGTNTAGGSDHHAIWSDPTGAAGISCSAWKLSPGTSASTGSGTSPGEPEYDGAGSCSGGRQLECSNFQHMEYYNSYHSQCHCAGENDRFLIL